ncbi:MAG: hypothetical protein LC114_05735 [Bryobacterales bacterium]|nr:hypothetical protein [Bryobacterales bacterium]
MESPGLALKRIREKLNLRYRDVETASHEIARRRGSDEYIIALSRLADIENKGTLPTLYRLYSLCAIYRLNPLDVLRCYGLPIDRLEEDSLLSPSRSTNLLPPDAAPAVLTSGNIREGMAGLDVRETRVLSRDSRSEGWLVHALLGPPRPRSIRVGIVGEGDDAMAPVLPPRSLVLIDDSRKKIARSGWRSEADRPIYFLETRNGYICRWCSVREGEILAIPHPSSTTPPERFAYPSEVEVVGEVVAVAMPRLPVRQYRTHS